ncbi:MAG: 5'/3'-nucleotidase SurE [Gammaproteobacteria bacterium]|nr:5'/3'-nucleotidase SurE [Gammaproteobacteria bacterium]
MKILISNDDGYLAPGIRALADELSKMGEITVVAPERDRSGASNSLTLDSPIRAKQAENGYYAVDGTPTDCVHLAITGLLEDDPDIVVSGINSGANMGDDVLYSGTVAAATEGRFLGYPAIAVSLVAQSGHEVSHYETAAKVVTTLMEKLDDHPLPSNTILNVNVPDIPWEELKGMEATRLGHRHRSEPIIKSEDPRGRPIYWVGPCGEEADAGPGTDFYCTREQKVSVTPLQIDLTRHPLLDDLSRWLSE